jgi:DUF1009 family protein
MADPARAGHALGIIAGGGEMPLEVAAASEMAVHILGIEGSASEAIKQYPHTWIKWGEIGKMLRLLGEHNCGQVVIIGSVARPDMEQIHLDFGAVRNLPFILGLTVGGDDSVLSNVVRFFEHKGFHVRGAHEIATHLVADKGVIGRCKPGRQDRKDIAKAVQVVEELGRLDVGQGAVVARDYVLAVEAAEGTDAMLERCGKLRQWGAKRRSGVLVKCPKPGQELRVDMPTIGSKTIELAAKAGLAGVAVMAGSVLMVGRDEVEAMADQEGMFVIGV